MTNKKDNGFDWVEFLARTGGALGMNEVRIRWKLRAWRDRMAGERASAKTHAAHLTREHKTCPGCGGLNNIREKKCVHCGARLHSRPVDLTLRFLRRFAPGLSAEMFLAGGMAAAYLATALAGRRSDLFSMHPADLVAMGGNWAPLVIDGEFWRLFTAVFLHGSIWHIGFNVYALFYIFPFARQLYGGNKGLFVFAVTGVVSAAVSMAWHLNSAGPGGVVPVSIGASGAIAGLIGLVLVWGHRDGTSFGVGVRNAMARWVLYILIFGFLVRADNAGHVGGWLSGGALAYLIPANLNREEGRAWPVLAGVSAAAVLAAVVWIAYLALDQPPG